MFKFVFFIGYKEMEFVGYFGYSVKDIRCMLDEEGLIVFFVYI